MRGKRIVRLGRLLSASAYSVASFSALSSFADRPEASLEAPDRFEVLESLRRRHHEALADLVEPGEERSALGARIDLILDGVSTLLDASPDGNPTRLRDQLMAAGEDLVVELALRVDA